MLDSISTRSRRPRASRPTFPNIGDNTHYDGAAIGVDPSSSLWDYDIVVCPISRFAIGGDVEEIRIEIQGDRASSSWCELHEAPNHSRSVDFEYARLVGSGRALASFPPPSSSARDGRLGLTARCLVFPGNSLTAIEVLWDR